MKVEPGDFFKYYYMGSWRLVYAVTDTTLLIWGAVDDRIIDIGKTTLLGYDVLKDPPKE